MGLWVESLENVPAEAKRDYYIYLLDYGWDEPIGDAVMKNYAKMASLAATSSAVVIRGTNRVHFEDQVLSWHNINGENTEDLLPAILITNRNPHKFKPTYDIDNAKRIEDDLRLILIPLKKFCRTPTEVVQLIERIFNDIKDQKALKDFRVAREVAKDNRRVLADAVILEPDNNGKEITIDSVVSYLKSEKRQKLVVEKTVLPIHFEDRSGNEFERLVFAFLNKYKTWDMLEWLGQTGDDDGRDIWGVIDGKSYCYQCANYRLLVTKKVTDDIDKLVKEQTIPDYFVVVCGGRVSVGNRKIIKSYALQLGIVNVEIWSGVEFEEKVRNQAPETLKRFVNGEDFPELTAQTDKAVLTTLGECFDRPAFTTPFYREVNIPDFEKAIVDTIEVLNTGIHRLRDGTFIKKIPSRHELTNPAIKEEIAKIYKLVVKLRDTFVDLKKKQEIKPCECGEVDCPVYILSDNACHQMDKIRNDIFSSFKSINPGVNLHLED